MLILILFAFLGGIITVLSPCILPLLPIILSSTTGGGKKRPFGIVAGFVASFTFFTLFLSSIVQLTGIPADSLRSISVVILIIFGLTLLVPQAQAQIEKLFTHLARFAPKTQNKTGFPGGLVIGASLGLLWTPCVGPILASVISLAISGEVTGSAFLITFAYSLGTAIPMFLIIRGGQGALQRLPWLIKNSGRIQKAFGILMILTALAIYQNVDRKFQTWFLDTFPNYGSGLTSLEDNVLVNSALQSLDMPNEPGTTDYPTAPEIIPDGEWINSNPFMLSELRGKVVLIDFWTYSCINCIRTLPYLRNWWEKYKDDGLVIIGVHTPEFEFEKDIDNLRAAVSDFELTYPIVQDNNYATWKAYKNRFWPAKYLIDKDGRIRYSHFGEGEYDETEKKIQELLTETGKTITENVQNPKYEVDSLTPEIYLGSSRYNGLGHISFRGGWNQTPEYIESNANAEIILDFYSKDVFLVMRSGSSTRVRIYLDNQEQEVITVSADKLYYLIKLERAGTHTLKLEFLDAGTQVFAFTFG
ncbi:hypothetical protein A2803_00620 [Candidatus Woesebacteria bacterium RIFCSPHIGHO2_01_FULL_44_21]|uniref:Thioredoxin domain-containing protein n=1 Tax=Candidatus Woesebacteria bacterium RIFCSPHIGHO2_01_FULL_44_21 TaxID=1802503 RepID=A0A1F7YXI2_9BACT|nr:MAG: hypothetical protein A2803_00620 [Candidatus Woesebacteria bacterium RIFCSPHIGHO2_01_FULL_44_21]OGM70366.1 MAG: hypothetical protein A2897_01050 [Candidatus Woesebacteria bacterium RIFCSPLOWO2_01_FULL_44_24b]